MLCTPEYVFQDVSHITPEFLAQKGIRALVLDVDNTLTADRSQELPPEVARWLADMKAAGIGLTILSNGSAPRVQPFAERLGLLWVSRAAKPLPPGMRKARRRLGVQRGEMAMVGDRLYTDIALGKKNGVTAILVLTGETTENDVSAAAEADRPDFVINSLADADRAIFG